MTKRGPWKRKTQIYLKNRAECTCADEEDIVGAVHGFYSVHQQFAKLVVNTHSDKEGALSQGQHIFLHRRRDFCSTSARYPMNASSAPSWGIYTKTQS